MHLCRKRTTSVQKIVKKKNSESILVKNALEGYLFKNAKKAAKPAAKQACIAARAARRAANLAVENACSSTRAPGRFSFANLVRKNGSHGRHPTNMTRRRSGGERVNTTQRQKTLKLVPKKKKWRVGDRCQAMYHYDGKYYTAYIIRVDKSSVYVEYSDYEGEFATLKMSEIQ